MQLIFDNIAALLIASAVLLILGGVNQRGQNAAIEANSLHAVKQQQLTFIQVMQHDLNSAVKATSVSIDPVSGGFTFHTRPDPSSSDVREVTYRRQSEQQPDGIARDRIVRIVDGRPSGETGPFVTLWDIRLLNGEGKAVSNAVDGRQVAVSLELTYPSHPQRRAVDKVVFETTFYPPLLQQRTTI